MSLDAKKNLIFNTFDGLEQQLSDPDPVKEVRNYRWALRQQTILFRNFLNDLQKERDALAGDYDKRVDKLNTEREAILADLTKQKEDETKALKQKIQELETSIMKIEKESEEKLSSLEKNHQAEIAYQMGHHTNTLHKQEKDLKAELLPRKQEFVETVRDAVRLEELSLAEKHLRELFVLTQNRAEDLVALSEELKVYAKDLNVFGSDFSSYLKKSGAKAFTPKVGSEYDSGKHDAVQIISDKAHPYNTILEVQDGGYTIQGRTLIRAQVIVNVLPNKVKEVQADVKVSDKDVRENVKELIDTFVDGGDVKQVRKMQLQRREQEVASTYEEHTLPEETTDEEKPLSKKELKAMKKAEKEAARLEAEEAARLEEEAANEAESTDEEKPLSKKELKAIKKAEKEAARLEAEEAARLEEEAANEAEDTDEEKPLSKKELKAIKKAEKEAARLEAEEAARLEEEAANEVEDTDEEKPLSKKELKAIKKAEKLAAKEEARLAKEQAEAEEDDTDE